MSALDRELLAERAQAVERHLARVAAELPATAGELLPASDASDAVVLHLWQATQVASAGWGRAGGDVASEVARQHGDTDDLGRRLLDDWSLRRNLTAADRSAP